MGKRIDTILSRDVVHFFTIAVLILMIVLGVLIYFGILDWEDMVLYFSFPSVFLSVVIANILNRFSKMQAAILVILFIAFINSMVFLFFYTNDLYTAMIIIVFISLYPFIISLILKPISGLIFGTGEILLLAFLFLFRNQLFIHFSTPELDQVFSKLFMSPAIFILCISFFSFYFGKSYTKSINRIKKSEQYTLDIINSMIDSLIIVNEQGKILSVNSSFLALTGYTEKELSGKSLDIIFDQTTGTHEQKEYIKNRIVQNLEKTIITPKGGKIPVLFSCSEISGLDDTNPRYVCTIQNVAEQKRHEQRILQLNSLLGAIRYIDQVITHESDIRVLGQKCCNELMKLQDYGHVSIAFLNRETRMIEPVARAGEHKMLLWKISIEGEGNAPYCISEVVRTRKWGLSFPQETDWCQCINCTCRNCHNRAVFPIIHNEQLYGVLSRCMKSAPISLENDIELMEEIADDLAFACVKYEAEQVLQQNEERYRMIINTMSSGLAVYRAVENGNDFVFIDFNRAGEMIDNIKKEELIGKKVTKVFPGVKDFGLLDVFQRVWNTGNPAHHPVAFYKDERIEGWRENYVYKLETGEIVAIYDDITEQKKAEERELLHRKQLMEANKLATLGILVSGIAHEINNPNNFIMLNTPVLKDIFHSFDPIIREYLKIQGKNTIDGFTYKELGGQINDLFSGISEGSERIKTIVNELKTFSGRNEETDYKEIDINKSILSSTVLVSNLLKKSTRNFTIDLDDVPPIWGNIQQIEQVIINLLQNACQALEIDTQAISISSRYNNEQNHIIVYVKDEGRGIDKDNLEKIFDPFYTTNRDKGGTGLGLSICQKIVRDHKGTISFTSELNKGTEVTLKFPALMHEKENKGGLNMLR